MDSRSLAFGLGGLIVGGVLVAATATAAVNNNNRGVMGMMGMRATTTMTDNDTSMTMNDMSDTLKGKTGDTFDKLFLSEMIVHHQGAIDMAKLAQTQAKHAEIKTMADDIIAAQSKEIDLMQSWQTDWNYKTVPTMMHDMHE